MSDVPSEARGENLRRPPAPRQRGTVLRWAGIAAFLVLVAWVISQWPFSAQLRLQITNTGSIPVTIVRDGGALAIQSHQTWDLPVRVGDSLKFYAGEDDTGPFTRVTMEQRYVQT